MDATVIRIILQKELRDTRRNRWFTVLSAVFGVLALTLSALGLSGLGTFGVTGFGRTAASLLHLVMLVVPLMGLLVGAMSVAGEREHGTLLTLLAQPVTPTEVLLGKFLGSASALAAALGLGFGASGLVIAKYAGVQYLDGYLALAALTILLGIASLAIGFLISVMAPRGATAAGLAFAVWLVLIVLGDLGIMGTAMVLQLSSSQVLWLSLWNPLQAFKLAALHALGVTLDSLGPAGRYAAEVFGRHPTAALGGLLLAWAVCPVGLAWRAFIRRGAL